MEDKPQEINIKEYVSKSDIIFACESKVSEYINNEVNVCIDIMKDLDYNDLLKFKYFIESLIDANIMVLDIVNEKLESYNFTNEEEYNKSEICKI